jgi:hypothetical protein
MITGDRQTITDQMPSAQKISAQVKPRTSTEPKPEPESESEPAPASQPESE